MSKNKKIIFKFIETELMVVLAIILLLGILFGYSLASAQYTTSVLPFTEDATTAPSLLGAGLGDENIR